MSPPRWQSNSTASPGGWGQGWDRFVAVWASLNLVWVAFDITYLPLRTFWLQRNLYPIPSVPLVVPLTVIPTAKPRPTSSNSGAWMRPCWPCPPASGPRPPRWRC
jgi:hypothetical protein